MLKDPWHRCCFHHANYRDWVAKCMTPGCKKKENEHGTNFCHDESMDEDLKRCLLSQYWK